MGSLIVHLNTVIGTQILSSFLFFLDFYFSISVLRANESPALISDCFIRVT